MSVCLRVCECSACMFGSHGCQKCVLSPLDLELKVVVSWELGQSPVQELHLLLTTELSLQPLPPPSPRLSPTILPHQDGHCPSLCLGRVLTVASLGLPTRPIAPIAIKPVC